MKVYIKAEESVCVNHAQVYLCDVLSLYCSDYETGEKLKKVRLYHFPSREKQRKIFSVLKVVEKIKEEDSQIEVVNMGPEDFVVSYEQKKEEKRWITAGKIIFVCLVAFFGASFSIMSYNTDVGIQELFSNVYGLIMGKAPDGPNILHFSYTAGLAAGIILFFNHAGKFKISDDPTPFEVQMRLYEKDVNNTLMIDAGREKVEEDVDT
ncbi:stage V sporulation protein AA [Anaerostipes butyraticus]|uniref:Stage V sporulation protein AA n=1 Tax=Anaerostipes butyraticus TaxID=645466 RepID=A0A916Q7U9_9FIRM|nr:stage V sporulation protein AA [Anaerostipes butyraticus]GFO84661.1 stage V sporulation protein AA [Anaerostipes butyraticus]HJC83522.1 stage V sporulation protein AA [Candidatus Anaerostipes avicola]